MKLNLTTGFNSLFPISPIADRAITLQQAVLDNKSDEVIALLKKGADPLAKDSQGLSALDHAHLVKNEHMIGLILGHKIGSDLSKVETTWTSPAAIQQAAELKKEVAEKQTLKEQIVERVKTDHPSFRAIMEGNVAALKNGNIPPLFVSSQLITPLECAVLFDQVEVLKYLLQSNQRNLELLHLAAMVGSHKAFAELVRQGANPLLENSQGVSPLAILRCQINPEDPLALSRQQIIQFTAITVFWLTSSIGQTGLLGPTFIKGALDMAQFYLHAGEFFQCFSGIASIVGYVLLSDTIRQFPPLNLLLQTYLTATIANKAFTGIKACWTHVRYRTWEAGRNAVVLTVNAGSSIVNLWKGLEQLRNWFAETPPELDAESPKADFNQIPNDPETPEAELGRILSLNPNNLLGASRILSNQFDPSLITSRSWSPTNFFDSKCDGEAKSYINGLYKTLALKYHPDKEGGNEAAFIKIAAAKETLLNFFNCRK